MSQLSKEKNCCGLQELLVQMSWCLKRFGGKFKLQDNPVKLKLGFLHEKTNKLFSLHFLDYKDSFNKMNIRDRKIFTGLLDKKQNRLDFVEKVNNSIKAK